VPATTHGRDGGNGTVEMTFTPSVSVVPVFDAEATIEACVEALLAQDDRSGLRGIRAEPT
jgi:hypothetical protein